MAGEANDNDRVPTLAELRSARSGRKQRSATPAAAPRSSGWLFGELPQAAPEPTPSPLAERVSPPKAAPSPPTPAALQQFATEATETPAVLSVSELVRRVRGLVERQWGSVTVEGEISNWRPAGSGHCYFTLKDNGAQLQVVLFRREAQRLRFRPKDGDAVRLTGMLSIYEARGQMQMVAERMEQVGLGALLEAVRLLKERLRREGLFDRQRPLPAFPRCIGVVTSLQGAALRDIVKVCRRRHAAVNLLVYPAAVQGPNCPREIAAGIRWFSQHPEAADVVLVARGGGSWEDLHGFDAEEIARAIAECPLPVVTGIGHAPDSVIADSAADLCAPTPSAAAELLTAAQYGIEERLHRLHARLLRAARYEMLRARQRFAHLSADRILRGAQDAVHRRAQRVDELEFRAENATERALRARQTHFDRLQARLQQRHPARVLSEDRNRLQTLQARLERQQQSLTERRAAAVDRATLRLEALSPLKVLDRGYSLVYTNEGKLVRTASQLHSGQGIVARFSEGRIRARVEYSE